MRAIDAAAAIADGWRELRPHDLLTLLPQADGGEGTLDALERALPHSVRHSAGLVTGPDGRPTPGEWLQLPGDIAVVELAQCSGLTLMSDPDPLGATTRGLGEVILVALAAGASSLVIALGGSASTDGGTGALRALGLRLVDESGAPLRDGGGALAGLAQFESAIVAPPPGGVTLLTDVAAPLLGPTGAAAVFGPQKGADANVVAALETGLTTLAHHIGGEPHSLGSGAAGGAAYGFATLWSANLTPGAKFIQHLTGLDELISTADVVVTGEGRFDETSTTGKVVGEVLSLTSQFAACVAVIAGSFATSSGHWDCSLSQLAGSEETAITQPLPHLHRAGRLAAAHFGTD